MRIILAFFLIVVAACTPKTTSSVGEEGGGKVEVNFVETTSLPSIVQQATRRKRPIFMSFYTDWCETCPWLQRDILKERSLAEILNDNFINVNVDGELLQGRKLTEEYAVVAFPTVLYLNSEGEEIYRYIGLPDKHTLIKLAKDAIQEEEKFQRQKERKKKY